METHFIFNNPPFKSCHAVTLAETPAGLVMACFGGSQEGAPDVTIWVTRQEGNCWQSPVEAATGLEGEGRFPCWNPVLYQVPGGPLFLFYKVGPNPKSWWGMLMQLA